MARFAFVSDFSETPFGNPLYWDVHVPEGLDPREVFIRRRIVLGLFVAAAIGSVVGMLPLLVPERRIVTVRKHLAEAALGARPVDGRLSLDLGYGVFDPRRPPPIAQAGKPLREVVRAAWREAEGRTAEALGLRGLLYLLDGDVNRAVSVLEEAVRRAPENARLWSDLAAAHHARGQRRRNARDLVLALHAAERALTADGSLQAARFNHALALDSLLLSGRAMEAWRKVADAEVASSGWTGEAERRLEALEEPAGNASWKIEKARFDEAARAGDRTAVAVLVSRFPQEVRLYVEDEILGAWGESLQTGDAAEAEATLAAARLVAETLAARGEWMPMDAIAAIEGAEEQSRGALAKGHAEYGKARKLYGERRAEAGSLFEQARKAFQQGGSPMAAWASLYIAIGTFERFDFAAARTELARLLDAEQAGRHPGLAGRTSWMLGLVLLAQGDPAASLKAYRGALKLFEKTGAREDALGVSVGLIETSHHLGDQAGTWNHLFTGLRLARQVDSPRRRHALLAEGAEACLEWGPAEAALAFRNEVVRVAGSEEPTALSHAILQRSDTLRLAGDLDGARHGLAEARRQLGRISNPDLRRRVDADLLGAEGELALTGGDPQTAIAKLSQALAFHGGRGNRSLLMYLSLARARAALAEGVARQAEADLRRGIEESERQSQGVADEALQISLFDRSRVLFDEMVRLQAGQPGGGETAFDFAERGRARALLDRVYPAGNPREAEEGGRIPSATARQVLAELPTGIALVEYTSLPDRLLVWVLRQGRIDLVQSEVSVEDLDRRVERLRSALRPTVPEREVRAAAAPLYDLLIRPLAPYLRPEDTLVLVPDRMLHDIPFSLLIDRSRGRYLVQDRATVLAPSASLFLWALQRDRALEPARNGSILAVGNPALRERERRLLRPLPWAEAEAAEVATLYSGSQVLIGPEATKSRFLAAIGEHEVVHFAGHAVENLRHPHLAHLLLAPDGALEGGFLYAHELERLHFRRTRLAVLAACSSAGRPVSGEGLFGLARAFLTGGVPTVAATYRPVEDRPASRFFRAFHRELRRGGNAATALRQAQLSLLADPDPEIHAPSVWAAFAVFGHPGCFASQNVTP